jgi:hypothetical protein
MTIFDFFNRLLRQVRDFFCLDNTQGFALGFAPTFQAFCYQSFVSLVGGLLKICAEYGAW